MVAYDVNIILLVVPLFLWCYILDHFVREIWGEDKTTFGTGAGGASKNKLWATSSGYTRCIFAYLQ